MFSFYVFCCCEHAFNLISSPLHLQYTNYTNTSYTNYTNSNTRCRESTCNYVMMYPAIHVSTCIQRRRLTFNPLPPLASPLPFSSPSQWVELLELVHHTSLVRNILTINIIDNNKIVQLKYISNCQWQ